MRVVSRRILREFWEKHPEQAHFPIPEPDDPAGVLEYYMESRGLSSADLIPYLGGKERVSE
jgi:antitoxin component HigA of HigAB toxin-antitoxin module